MKVFTCISFAGHWPVGTAAVVTARTADEAAALLNAALKQRGLLDDVKADALTPVNTTVPQATILLDGDY